MRNENESFDCFQGITFTLMKHTPNLQYNKTLTLTRWPQPGELQIHICAYL